MDPLDALRPLMATYSPPLHAILVPSEDAHQSEYVAAHDTRRAYVSGFTGSAGLAAITMNEALLWTDGRYFLQATQQLSSRWKLMRIGEDPVVEAWLAENLEKGANVGVDPWLISVETAQKWEQAFAKKGQKLIQLNRNLVDEIWKDRPQPEILPISAHPLKFAGQPCGDKLSQIRSKISQEKACAIILTALDEIAWLFNVRGKDVQYNPVVHSYAIVMLDSAFFYVDQRKITSEVESYFKEAGIEVRDYSSILSDVEHLASGSLYPSTSSDCSPANGVHEKEQPATEHKNGGIGDCGLSSEGTLGSEINQQVSEEAGQVNTDNLHKEKCGLIWLDPGSCCYALYSKLHPDQSLLRQSPIAFAKALKNPVELDGLRNAHIRDGAALVSYFAWLDHQMQEVYGAAGYFSDSKGTNKRKRSEADKLTEVSVSNKLEEFRAKQEHFMGLSFETISSVGSNAAIIHYAPQPDTCAELQAESIYLCDSGGQYLDGTTDVTRTVHFGKPSAHEKTCYTMVLKGHIALDAAVFPNGTTGHALDILARVPLWQLGLDYRHGTGHGVGSYLNVHEGPHLISFRPHARNVAIQASMTVTDEPGYYEDGNFGIRLENVLIVTEAKTSFNFANKGYLSFEHITWMPYQKKLIDILLLSPSEKEWIDNYHINCREKLTPLLNGSDLEWLIKATEPLSVSDSI